MTEDDPFKGSEDAEPEVTEVQLSGPNISSTLESPPSPDALRVRDAAVRKHLKDPPTVPEHTEEEP